MHETCRAQVPPLIFCIKVSPNLSLKWLEKGNEIFADASSRSRQHRLNVYLRQWKGDL